MAVTYQTDETTIEVIDERGAMIAGIDEMDGEYVVSYGPGLMKEKGFRTLDGAKRWVEKNEGDIADGLSL